MHCSNMEHKTMEEHGPKVGDSRGDAEKQAAKPISKVMVAKEWNRAPVDNFENMSLVEFSHYAEHHMEILRESMFGPTSMKHPSWGDSHLPPGPCVPLVMGCSAVLAVAVGVGLAIGFTVGGVAWGIGSGAIVVGAAFVASFASLLTYMVCYGNGLHMPPMPGCVERGGFVCNVRANIVCRYLMTCFYNGHCDLVGCIMNHEADSALAKIQKMNDGEGPPPGGVCWLGDSEFTFWHTLSEDMKGFHSHHFNAGFGGSRIADIQRNVDRLCLDWDPSIVIVHASGNDYDCDTNVTAKDIPARLMRLFETIAAHPSVKRIGYMLTSRRPVYDDAKWDFMVRVHILTIEAIARSPLAAIVRVFDLRPNTWPLDYFVPVDRVHLNDTGHFEKSKELLPKLLAAWPSVSSQDVDQPHESPEDIVV